MRYAVSSLVGIDHLNALRMRAAVLRNSRQSGGDCAAVTLAPISWVSAAGPYCLAMDHSAASLSMRSSSEASSIRFRRPMRMVLIFGKKSE